MGKLGNEIKALAKHCGGSHKTVNDRIHIVQRFDHHLRALNIQIQRVAQIKVRHIETYINERLTQGIGKRTLQNEMAALRAVLQQAGRKQIAEHEQLTGAFRRIPQRYTAGHHTGSLPPCAGNGASERSGTGGSTGAGTADGTAFSGGGAMRSVAENVATGAGSW